MDKVWIVMGDTGEYSDRSEWVVEAHATEVAAQARVEALETMLREAGLSVSNSEIPDYHERNQAVEAIRGRPDGDPGLHVDYTGARYSLASCPFKP